MRALHALLLAWLVLLAVPALASPPGLFRQVGFDQRLGATLPLDAPFREADGTPVTLGRYFGHRPVVLVLGYYGCPNLCGVQWRGLLESAREVGLDIGRDYQVVAISIDPTESPALAREKRRTYLDAYDRAGSDTGWHFLTGEQASIRRVAEAVGFRYVYDPELEQYAHAAGLVVATPEGVVARYLFGVRFPARDLRLALVESSAGRVGTPVDRLLLLCYHYDPANGQYGATVMNLLRGGGALTLGALIGFVWLSRRRESARPDGGQGDAP